MYNRNMSVILFYVSGHGFGHAVRAAQVAASLAFEHGVRVIIRTAAPQWLFPESENIVVERADVDAGPAQIDCLTTDLEGTLLGFGAMVSRLDERVEAELDTIRKWRPSAIVCDISPLGVAAGASAGIPTLVVANFLWDWILADYEKQEPAFANVASALSSIYEKATAILKTPLSGGMEKYSNILEIPLIARRSQFSKEEAKKRLGLPLDKKFALVSLGGLGSDRFFSSINRRVTVCGLLSLGDRTMVDGRMRWYDRRVTAHEDLMAAADVVIGKMGYGLCSEIIAAKRPFLYTPRHDFVEYFVLAEETARHVAVKKVNRTEFFEANLDGCLEELFNTETPSTVLPAINGADVAARIIVEYANGDR